MRFTATSFAAIAMTMLSYAMPSTLSAAAAQDSIQTGDGLIMLRADMPDQVRVGEQFTYSVNVTNSSDNVVLHDIKLKQKKAKGFTVESVSMKSDSQKSNEDKSESKEKTSDSNGSSEMTISVLNPGQSKTFDVKATADSEGQLKSCLEIASYKPAICLTSEVVKPQLELTKTAPKKADRCNVIELEYTLTNGGSGDVGAIVITDDLGDGLATIEGNQSLKFDVDGLKAGDSRKFVANVYARKPGTFSSRAMAKAKQSDLKSRSKQTETEVIAADLNVNLTGSSRIYGDQLAQFNAKVTNTGNTEASDVRVTVMWPRDANLADMSEVSKQKSDKKSSDSSSPKGEPTVATENKGNNGDESSSGNSNQNNEMQMSERTFAIENLAAGQTATFDYAIRPGNLGKIPTKVKARYVCTVDAAQDQSKAKSESISMAMVTAKVVRLPALQVVILDDEDPVANGGEVVYTARVWNEGDAKDENVQLVVQLPEELEFVKAEGPTEHSKDGSSIKFDSIKTLNAGDRKDYKVTAKATADASVRVKAELTSDMLNQKIVSEEPTQLFKQ